MRLDFNILWVEDQKDNVQAQRERVEMLLEQQGFRLQVKFASSISEAKGYLADDIYGDHIDLILMDYDFGEGEKGDVGLKEVRNIFPYKDIIFYSAQAQDLTSKTANISGVFCSTRSDLPDTVDGVFETLVKKVLDIDHSRGIVMGATSDIDQCVNDCLVAIFDKCSPEEREAILGKKEKRLKEICENFEKGVEEIKAVSHISELFCLHHIYTSNDRLRLLKYILEMTDKDKSTIDSTVEYITNIVPKRSILAHVHVKEDGFSRKLFDGKGNELTSEQMKELRMGLLKYQKFFEDLSISLSN